MLMRKFAMKTALTMAFTVAITVPSVAQQIVTSGLTATTLNTIGNTTDVTTATIKGGNAFNSFTKFNVDQGNVVNLIVPTSANTLINVVNGAPSAIYGVLNSVKNGKIGGDVFIINPYGIVIGSKGQINAGSLSAITPTKDFVDNFFKSAGNSNQSALNAVLDGTAPISVKGYIDNNGNIYSKGDINFITNEICNKGNIKAFDSIGLTATTVNNRGEMFTNVSALGQVVNLDSVKDLIADKDIVINADKISIASGSLNATKGSVIISRKTEGNIELTNNKSSSSNNLQLTASELGRIKSKNLAIGNTDKTDNNANTITSKFDIKRNGGLTINASDTVNLKNIDVTGDVNLGGGSQVTAGNIYGNNIFLASGIRIDTGNIKAKNNLDVFVDREAHLKDINVGGSAGFSSSTDNAGVQTGNITAGKNVSAGVGTGFGNIKAGGYVSLGADADQNTGNIIAGEFVELGSGMGAVRTGDITTKGDINLSSSFMQGSPIIAGRLQGKNINVNSGGEFLITKDICSTGDVNLGAGILTDFGFVDGKITTGNIKASGNVTASTHSSDLGKSGKIVMKDVTAGKNISLFTRELCTGNLTAGGNVIIDAYKGKLGNVNSKGFVGINNENEHDVENVLRIKDIFSDSYLSISGDNSINIGNVTTKGNITATGQFLGVGFGNVKTNGTFDFSGDYGIDAKDISAGRSIIIASESSPNLGNLYAGDSVKISTIGGPTTKNIIAKNNISISSGALADGTIRTGNLSGNNIKVQSFGPQGSVYTGDVKAKGSATISAAKTIATGNIEVGNDLLSGFISEGGAYQKAEKIQMKNIKAGDNVTLKAHKVSTGKIKAGGKIVIIKD